MPRTLSPDTITALSSGSPRFVVLVRIQTPTLTLRMTSNSGPVAFNGEVYNPGTLGSIGAVREDANMANTLIAIDFSGVDLPTLAVAASPDFINSPVSVWLLVESGAGPLADLRGDLTTVTADNTLLTADEMNGFLSGSLLLFSGFTAGAPSISYGQESRVVVQCKGKFAALDRPRTERYADQDQQRKYPGDVGMQYASTVSSRDVIWPASSWFKNKG